MLMSIEVVMIFIQHSSRGIVEKRVHKLSPEFGMLLYKTGGFLEILEVFLIRCKGQSW